MRWLLAMGFLIGLMLPFGDTWPCDLHQIPERDKELIMVAPLETTGMFLFQYDSNHDGIADAALIFQQGHDGKYLPWPLFYLKEVDSEGRAQEVWIDRGGNGVCAEIVLYWIRRM